VDDHQLLIGKDVLFCGHEREGSRPVGTNLLPVPIVMALATHTALADRGGSARLELLTRHAWPYRVDSWCIGSCLWSRLAVANSP